MLIHGSKVSTFERLKGIKVFTKQEVEEIISLIQQKLMSEPTKQKSIRNKIRKLGFFASDFGLYGGYTVYDFLGVVKIAGGESRHPQIVTISDMNVVMRKPIVTKSYRHKNRDEDYVIDLCDEVLGYASKRQHRFKWLTGDSGRLLTVDAYYPQINLVIEYMERQHTEAVPHFDKRGTVSGVSRGEQRKIYDERRQQLIPKNGLTLTIFNYHEFSHGTNKRLLRNRTNDEIVIRKKLKKFIR